MPKHKKRKPIVADAFLKYAGGKREIRDNLLDLAPASFNNYFEPFVGGGAMFFKIQERAQGRCYLSDNNPQLINGYEQVKGNLHGLLSVLYSMENSSEFFYKIRAWDRTEPISNFHPVYQAARFIYLNRTCHGGLQRCNSQGQFNTPYGNYKNPTICNVPLLVQVSALLNNPRVELGTYDFSEVLAMVQPGDLALLDPPLR